MPPSLSARQIDELIRRDLAVLWHPAAQMRDYRDFSPLPVVGAQGCRIQLADGREILDAISSWWCKSLGHGHPRLTAALIEQAKQFEHVILANTTNEQVVRLCERLVDLANGAPRFSSPRHFSKVFLADNGSTAVEIAMKMAIQAQAQRGMPQRRKFASFQNGYHGETIGTLSLGDLPLYGRPTQALQFPVFKITGLPYRTGPGDPRWHDASTEWPGIEQQLEPIANELAAIVYEPVLQAAGGMQLYSPDLLMRLRRWADAHDVYLVADEIASGMGRLGAMLASHLAHTPTDDASPNQKSSHPDFVILSKGLTGGFLPLSAVITTNAIYDLFDADYVEMKAFLHSNTYTGNALAVAVANATLDVFEEEHILNHVAGHGPILLRLLQEIAGPRPYLKNVRACGMVGAVDIRNPDGSPLDWKKRTGYRVYREAVRRGALLRPLGDTMYLFPPLNTSSEDLAKMVAILADSLDAVLG